MLSEVGLVDQALETLEEGEQAARAGGIAHDVAEADLERARLALLRHEHRDARRHAARAERRFARGSETAWAVRASLLRLQAELLARSQPARHRCLAVGPRGRPGPRQRGGGGGGGARCRGQRPDPGGPTWRANSSPDPRCAAQPRFPLRLQRTLALAELHAAEGRPDLVRRELRRGAHRLAVEQARHTSIDSRTAAALHTGRLRDAHLDLAIASGSPAQVFDATELWRGVSQRLPRLVASP